MNNIKKLWIIVVSLVLLFLSVDFTEITAQSKHFNDVPENNSFFDYINNLNNLGIIKGYDEDNTFRPNNNLTRAQAAKMIVLAANIDTKDVSSNFSDVKKDSTSYTYISAAYRAGIIGGYEDGTIYRPNDSVTRAQIAKMATLAFNLMKDGNPPTFTDVEKLSSIATREYIYTLSSLEIVKGYGTDFRPQNNVTRGQFSKIISLAMEKYNPNIKVYTITVDNNGETSVHRVEHGKDLILPKPNVKAGYDFMGWSHNGKNITSDLNIKSNYKKQTKTGFYVEDGKTFYYKDDKKLTGFIQVDSDRYYIDYYDGMVTGEYSLYDEVTQEFQEYYFNESGIMQTGKVKVENKYYYYDFKTGAKGYGLKTIDNITYYFDEYDGMQTGSVSIFDETEDELYEYYFNDKGHMQTGFIEEHGNVYYYDPIKGYQLNKFVEIDGNTYYFNYGDGMVTGHFVIYDLNEVPHEYFFDENGIMQTGFVDYNNATYYHDATGKLVEGWITVNNKKYFNSFFGILKDDIYSFYNDETENYDIYHAFDKDGVMITGFYKQEDRTYYFDLETGKQVRGFLTLNNKTYYFTPQDGIMVTGTYPIEDEKTGEYHEHYFDENGVMQTGFVKIEGYTYYYKPETGRKVDGFVDIDGATYYFDYYGLATGIKVIYDFNNQPNEYYFSNKGIMQKGLVTIDDKVYFYNLTNGKKMNGYQTVDGSLYYFNQYNGEMISNQWLESNYFGDNGKKNPTITRLESQSSVHIEADKGLYNKTYSDRFNYSSQPRSIYYYELNDTFNSVISKDNYLYINTYDKNMKMINEKKIKMPLDKMGSFIHADDGNFYVLTGQDNTEMNDNKTVLRLQKYNSSWQLLGSLDFKGSSSNRTYGIQKPFDAGSVDMDYHNGELIIHMARLMYEGSDGLSHQGNISFRVNTSTMKEKPRTNFPYTSHSFNQFVKYVGNEQIFIDHGDAFPREMISYSTKGNQLTLLDIRANDSFDDINDPYNYNYTGSTITGFEVGKTNGLVIGNSTPQNETLHGITGNSLELKRNIYLVTFDFNLSERNFQWITTHHPKNSDVIVSEPQLVKINDDRFVILFTETKDNENTLIYKLINENGEVLLTGEYPYLDISGSSQPIVYNNKLVWLTSGSIDYVHKNYFYEIPLILK